MRQIAVPLASFTLLALLAALPLRAADMKDPPAAKKGAGRAAAEQVHKGSGTVKGVDAKAGKISLAHGPIASLNWPAMTMGFPVKDTAVLNGVMPGQSIDFDLVQAGPGQFVITRIAPAAKKK